MNTWAYLILIAALLFLAAVMLYARFATRSREKSLHHSPADWMFSSEAISAANESAATVRSEDEEMTHAEVKVDRVAPSSIARSEGEGESKRRESEYFDELQEAAAGLAMLMRSSPVGRTEPVVFAPVEGEEIEAEESEAADGCFSEESPAVDESVDELPEPVGAETMIDAEPESADEPVAGAESTVESLPEPVVESETIVESLTEATVETEALAEPAASVEAGGPVGIEEDECEVSLPTEVRVLTMRDLLGEDVSERMDRIDEGLDELESLVRDIESSLLALDSTDPIEGEDDLGTSAAEFVPAAA